MHMIVRAALSIGLLALCGAGALADGAPPLTQGQTVYAPVYSEVMHGDRNSGGKPAKLLMAAMLSIRNTDPANALTVRSIRYYDSMGKMIREYPAGKPLGPLATREVFVENTNSSGGPGANFLVVWDAAKPINAPLIETVHSNFFGTRSVAFISRGQPLHVDGH